MVSKDWINGKTTTKKNRKIEKGCSVTVAREIHNRKGCRGKQTHGMSIKVLNARVVVWEILIGKLWVNTERRNIAQNCRTSKIQPVV